jgi:hypothetical protein
MENENQFNINQLNEGAWETLKYYGAKAGRFEKGGSMWGRGERSEKAKQQIDTILAANANGLVKMMRDRLPKGFPNNKSNEEFVKGAEKYLDTYNFIVSSQNTLGTDAANEVIKSLRVVLKHDLDYKLASIYQVMKESIDNPITTNNDDSTTIKTLKSNKLPMALAALGLSLGPWGWLAELDWAKEWIAKGADASGEIKEVIGAIGKGQGLTQFLQQFGGISLGPNDSVENFKAAMAKLGDGDIEKGFERIQPSMAHPEGLARLKEVIDQNPNATMGEIFKQNQMDMTSGKGGSWFEVKQGDVHKLGDSVKNGFLKKMVTWGLQNLAAPVVGYAAGAALGAAAMLKGARMYGLKHSRAAVLQKILSELHLLQPNPNAAGATSGTPTTNSVSGTPTTATDASVSGTPTTATTAVTQPTKVNAQPQSVAGGEAGSRETEIVGVQANGSSQVTGVNAGNNMSGNSGIQVAGNKEKVNIKNSNNQNIIIIGKKSKMLKELINAGVINREDLGELPQKQKEVSVLLNKKRNAKTKKERKEVDRELEGAIEELNTDYEQVLATADQKQKGGAETASGTPETPAVSSSPETPVVSDSSETSAVSAEDAKHVTTINTPEAIQLRKELIYNRKLYPQATVMTEKELNVITNYIVVMEKIAINPEMQNVKGMVHHIKNDATDVLTNKLTLDAFFAGRGKLREVYYLRDESVGTSLEEEVGNFAKGVRSYFAIRASNKNVAPSTATPTAKVSAGTPETPAVSSSPETPAVSSSPETPEPPIDNALKALNNDSVDEPEEEIEEVDPNQDGAISNPYGAEHEEMAKKNPNKANLDEHTYQTLIKYRKAFLDILADDQLNKGIKNVKKLTGEITILINGILKGRGETLEEFNAKLEKYKKFFATKTYKNQARRLAVVERFKAHGINIDAFLGSGTQGEVNSNKNASKVTNPSIKSVKSSEKITKYKEPPYSINRRRTDNLDGYNPDGSEKRRLYNPYKEVLLARLGSKVAAGIQVPEHKLEQLLMDKNPKEFEAAKGKVEYPHTMDEKIFHVLWEIKGNLNNMLTHAELSDEQKAKTQEVLKVIEDALKSGDVNIAINSGYFTGLGFGKGEQKVPNASKEAKPNLPKTPKPNVPKTPSTELPAGTPSTELSAGTPTAVVKGGKKDVENPPQPELSAQEKLAQDLLISASDDQILNMSGKDALNAMNYRLEKIFDEAAKTEDLDKLDKDFKGLYDFFVNSLEGKVIRNSKALSAYKANFDKKRNELNKKINGNPLTNKPNDKIRISSETASLLNKLNDTVDKNSFEVAKAELEAHKAGVDDNQIKAIDNAIKKSEERIAEIEKQSDNFTVKDLSAFTPEIKKHILDLRKTTNPKQLKDLSREFGKIEDKASYDAVVATRTDMNSIFEKERIAAEKQAIEDAKDANKVIEKGATVGKSSGSNDVTTVASTKPEQVDVKEGKLSKQSTEYHTKLPDVFKGKLRNLYASRRLMGSPRINDLHTVLLGDLSIIISNIHDGAEGASLESLIQMVENMPNTIADTLKVKSSSGDIEDSYAGHLARKVLVDKNLPYTQVSKKISQMSQQLRESEGSVDSQTLGGMLEPLMSQFNELVDSKTEIDFKTKDALINVVGEIAKVYADAFISYLQQHEVTPLQQYVIELNKLSKESGTQPTPDTTEPKKAPKSTAKGKNNGQTSLLESSKKKTKLLLEKKMVIQKYLKVLNSKK